MESNAVQWVSRKSKIVEWISMEAPHTLRGPRGNSTEGPSCTVHMQFPAHFGKLFTSFVAP
eukprot:9473804-Pyramimonas_sp.AAC.1